MFYYKLLFGLVFFTIIYSTHLNFFKSKLTQYFQKRRSLIKRSENSFIGGNIRLTKEEELVNAILMKLKNDEFEEGFKDPQNFLASQHFFKSKSQIEQSKVFKIIQKLPKAASLHSHDTAMVSDEYVFNNITFRNYLYANEDDAHKIGLKFFKNPPGNGWLPIAKHRELSKGFNGKLKRQLSLVRTDLEPFYENPGSIWKNFEGTFATLTPMLTYKPVFKDYFYQALKELYEDNVRYVEFRGLLPPLYDLDGNQFNPEDVLRIYYETSLQFANDHPDFWGAKLIFAPHRFVNESIVEGYVDFVGKMMAKFPNFIAGFDLVGQEDAGPPLKLFISALLKMKGITKVFFHAGETLWNGQRTDQNLFDAVLLNATRIGHAYAILKHPQVLRMVKDKGIALEICPISNQVLGLVNDLRNHPANYLIANDYPLVIAADDPGLWGAKGLSYDWYMAFMGMAGRNADLRLLKQLALNSIIYSSMEKELKEVAFKKWQDSWMLFLKEIVAE